MNKKYYMCDKEDALFGLKVILLGIPLLAINALIRWLTKGRRGIC